MTHLYVDVGNTRLKWAVYQQDALQVAPPVEHRQQDMVAILDEVWSALAVPNQVLVSCVASGQLREGIGNWTQQKWGVQAEFITSPAQGCNVKNGYQQPEQLGCDRWLAMVAARSIVQSAVLVIDCGSAITLDVVDGQGQHLGGLIVPGFNAMQSALAANTSLSIAPVRHGQSFRLGTTTQAGIELGITHAIAALVSRTLDWLQQERGINPACFITGGDARLLSSILEYEHTVDQDLVLKGLARVASGS